MRQDKSHGQIDFLPMPPTPHPRIGWAFTCRAGGFSEGAWGGREENPPDSIPPQPRPDASTSAGAMPPDTGAGSLPAPHGGDQPEPAPSPDATRRRSPGLNLGALCGDDPAAVARNRALLSEAIGQPISWLKQVHANAVFIADGQNPAASATTPPSDAAAPTPRPTASAGAGDWPEGGGVATGNSAQATASSAPRFSLSSPGMPDPRSAPEADAQISTQPGRALAVLVADCLPALFADSEGRVIGAAHAGWRGLLDGVLEATVQQMKNRVPDARIVAWLGPCIGPDAFEVGEEVREAFVSRDPAAANAFVASANPGKWLADLPMLARQRLARVGVTQVLDSGHCTYRDPERFWSFRRDRTCGRMAGVVWLKPPSDTVQGLSSACSSRRSPPKTVC